MSLEPKRVVRESDNHPIIETTHPNIEDDSYYAEGGTNPYSEPNEYRDDREITGPESRVGGLLADGDPRSESGGASASSDPDAAGGPASEEDAYDSMTKDELLADADERGIEVKRSARVDEIRESLRRDDAETAGDGGDDDAE